MFGLGLGEILVVVMALVLLINPKKLPELLRRAGRFFGRIQKLADSFKEEVKGSEESKYRNQ